MSLRHTSTFTTAKTKGKAVSELQSNSHSSDSGRTVRLGSEAGYRVGLSRRRSRVRAPSESLDPRILKAVSLVRKPVTGWTVSSAGRAPALQAGGHRFEPCTVHYFQPTRANVAQLVEQLTCNQQVIGSSPIVGFMGEFPSGQRGQTVNLLALPSVVRIHFPPLPFFGKVN